MAKEQDITAVAGVSGSGNDLAPGQNIGGYVIEKAIACGGQGTVYEVVHSMLQRRAALKVLHPELAGSLEMIERFMREARVVNQIRHPSIVDVFDFGRLPDGRPFYLMELLHGQTLSDLLNARGRFEPAQILAYLRPVCGALAAAHQAGVVHRDLKASNVVIVKDGDPPEVKLLDFGIAKLVHPEPGEVGLTRVGQRLGSAGSMAPEQYRGEGVDHRVDIYALGVLLFRLLTGKYPFLTENPFELERLHLEATPPRPSQFAPVSAAVDAVVLRALEKKPDRRYPSAVAFLEALTEAVKGPVDAGSELRTVEAAGIFVNVSMESALEEDETALVELSDILDTAEQALTSANFVLSPQTGRALLGVRVLPDDPAQAVQARREAVEAGRSLYQKLLELQSAPGIQLAVCVHAAKAAVRLLEKGPVVESGEILGTSSWGLGEKTGFRATEQATQGPGALPVGGV